MTQSPRLICRRPWEPLTRAGCNSVGRGQSDMMGRIPFEGQEGGWEVGREETHNHRLPPTTSAQPATRTPSSRAWSGAVQLCVTLFSVVPAALVLAWLYLALIRALVKHPPPPFTSLSSEEILPQASFYTSFLTCWDSTVPDAADLVSAPHPGCKKTELEDALLPELLLPFLIGNDCCVTLSLASPLWASSYHLCNQWVGDSLQGSFHCNLLYNVEVHKNN